MVAHVLNSSTWETDQAVLCKFEGSLVYKWSSRPASSQDYTVRPCLKGEKEKKEKKEREKKSSLCFKHRIEGGAVNIKWFRKGLPGFSVSYKR